MALFNDIKFDIDREDGHVALHVSLARGRGHITDDRWGKCWCHPRVIQGCPICFTFDLSPDTPLCLPAPLCLACKGEGWVDQFTSDPEWPTMIIHNKDT